MSQAWPEASQEMVDNYRWVSGQGMEYMTPSRSPYLNQSRLWQDKEKTRQREFRRLSHNVLHASFSF